MTLADELRKKANTLRERVEELCQLADSIEDVDVRTLREIYARHIAYCGQDIRVVRRDRDGNTFEVYYPVYDNNGFGFSLTNDLLNHGYIVSGYYKNNILPYKMIVKKIHL